jgi:hypothetical protein
MRASVLELVQPHDIIMPMWRRQSGETSQAFTSRIALDAILLQETYYTAPLIDLGDVEATKAACWVALSNDLFGLCPFGIGSHRSDPRVRQCLHVAARAHQHQ